MSGTSGTVEPSHPSPSRLSQLSFRTATLDSDMNIDGFLKKFIANNFTKIPLFNDTAKCFYLVMNCITS